MPLVRGRFPSRRLYHLEEVRLSFGNGLLTSQDGGYRRQRRLIQPLFTRRRVDGYADAIGIEAEVLVERWSAVPGGVVEAADEMSRFACGWFLGFSSGRTSRPRSARCAPTSRS